MVKTLRKARTAGSSEAEVPPAPEELGLDEVDAASAASMDASRAYELWHDAGCPEGRALDYWLAAERELGLAADARELTN